MARSTVKPPRAASSALSRVPVFFLHATDMPDGRRFLAGHVDVVDRADAAELVMRGLAVRYAPCSVLRRCVWPHRGLLEPSPTPQGLPFDVAERLEAVGHVRILRTDAELEQHRAAWRDHETRRREMVARARALHHEADQLAREASRATSVPVFPWTEHAQVA